MAIVTVAMNGTDKLSASRAVINSNFGVVRDAINSLLSRVVNNGIADTLVLQNALNTSSPLNRWSIDAGAGVMRMYANDGVTVLFSVQLSSGVALMQTNKIQLIGTNATVSIDDPGTAVTAIGSSTAVNLTVAGDSTSKPSSVYITKTPNFVGSSLITIATLTYSWQIGGSSWSNTVMMDASSASANVAVTPLYSGLVSADTDGMEVLLVNKGTANQLVFADADVYGLSGQHLYLAVGGSVVLRRVAALGKLVICGGSKFTIAA